MHEVLLTNYSQLSRRIYPRWRSIKLFFFIFSFSPQSFQTDAAKIYYVIGLLRGQALKWAEAKLGQQVLFQGTYDSFVSAFKQTFGYTESHSVTDFFH
uniref:DUF4939 domain-containing protein n=1 Tax=Xiphophorus couchianus TaxID=32473 RepID=A0A3B5MFF1_9TELE